MARPLAGKRCSFTPDRSLCRFILRGPRSQSQRRCRHICSPPCDGWVTIRAPAKGSSDMISRYSRAEMSRIWSNQNRYRIWFEIEAHACDAQAALGVIPESAARAVWQRGKFEVERIDEIERETHHDVIAFLTNLAEHVGPEARFVHQGMTSSDVLDTCFAVQLKEAADILLADLDGLLGVLKRRAFEHKFAPTVGRS